MAVKDFPAIGGPDAESWTLEYNTQSFESDLTGSTQTASLPGARWSVSMTFTNRTGKDARALQGFLAGLGGRAGRFWVTPADYAPLGSAEDGGTVGGLSTLSLDFVNQQYYQQSATATFTGSELVVSGYFGLDSPLFCAGDYFEVNGELKKLTEDAAVDSQGQATLRFAPPLRNPVTRGQQVRVEKPRAQMMLVNDQQASWDVSAPTIYAVTLEAREALDI